ncbi:unnamed protein product, partial [Allacma fusca]
CISVVRSYSRYAAFLPVTSSRGEIVGSRNIYYFSSCKGS